MKPIGRLTCLEKDYIKFILEQIGNKVDQLDYVVWSKPADGVHLFKGSSLQHKFPIGVIVCYIDPLFACQGETKNKEDYGDWNDKPGGNEKVMDRVFGHVLHCQDQEDALHTC